MLWTAGEVAAAILENGRRRKRRSLQDVRWSDLDARRRALEAWDEVWARAPKNADVWQVARLAAMAAREAREGR